jgi:hypothetical protein
VNHAANTNKLSVTASDICDNEGNVQPILPSESSLFKFPIAICNIGETRAERMNLPGIVFKSEANCANILKAVIDLL